MKVFFNGREELLTYCRSDDTINTIVKKLAANLCGTSPGNIFLNLHKSVVKNVDLETSFIHNVFKADSLVDMLYFATCVDNVFDVKVDIHEGRNHPINKSQALKVLEGLSYDHIYVPLTFSYKYDVFVEQSIDYRKNHEDVLDVSNYTLHDQRNFTLTHFEMDAAVDVINVILRKGKSEILFPFHHEKSTKNDTFIANLIQVEELIENREVPTLHVNEYITYFQAKGVFHVPHDLIDLSLIFDKFHVNKSLVFIKYHGKNNIYYKILRDLIGDLPLEKWSQYRLEKESFIDFKFKTRKNTICHFKLTSSFSYELKINSTLEEKLTLSDIDGLCAMVDSKVRSGINDIFDMKLPAVDIRKMNIHNLVAYDIFENYSNGARYAQLEKIVNTLMVPYFNIITINDKSVLYLQYKRVDNFMKQASVSDFIATQVGALKDKAAVVQKIQDYFMMTANEAENEYDVWYAKQERNAGARKREKPPMIHNFGWHTNNTTVKIKLNESIDTKVLISGVKNLKVLPRIKYLLGVLFDISRHPDIDSYLLKAPKLRLVDETHPSDSLVELDDSDFDSDTDELMKQLMELDKEEDAGPSQRATKEVQPHVDASRRRKPQGYVLNKLKEADPALFDYESKKDKKRKDYPSICGWTDTRQPVVISQEEKANIDSKFPKAYDDFIQVGSTADLAKKNYYICPKIWCPSSRVAMSQEQFSKNGNKCPIPEEQPILFNKYWSKDETTALKVSHHIGLLNDDIHPDGLCLPCCFKKPMKQNVNRTCRIGDSNPVADQGAHETNDDMGNEKYIKDGSYFPLQSNRFGLLPDALKDVFGPGHCGSRYNGTGLMESGKTCYLRHGINQMGCSFVNCIEEILNNGVNILSTIAEKLALDAFISVENGKLMKMFVDDSLDIQNDSQYNTFISWMKDSPAAKLYVERFNLQDIDKLSRVDPNLIREFIIYGAYNKFIEYIKSETTVKNHVLLLDLIHTDVVNINTSNKHFIIFDVDLVANEARIICPYHKNVGESLNVNTQKVCFIVKVNNLYEPICELTIGSGLINTLYEFSFHDMNPKMKALTKKYINGCGRVNPRVHLNGENLATFLETKGYTIKAFVVQYNFKLSGLILDFGVGNELYIPFLYEYNFDYLSKQKFVYYNYLATASCSLPFKKIEEIYKLVEGFTGSDSYKIEFGMYDEGENLIALELKDKMVVPLNVADSHLLTRNLMNDLYIFTDVIDEDERIRIMKDDAIATESYALFYKAANSRLNNDQYLRQQVEFLLSDNNPLPESFKRDKLISLMSRDKKTLSHAFKFASELLNKYIRANKISNGFSVNDNEILVEQGELHTNVFKTIIENKRNPFKMIIEHIDNEDLKFTSIDDIYEIIYTRSMLPDDPKYDNIPVVHRGALRSFSIVVKPENYDPSWLYAHFVNLSRFIYPNRFVTIDTIKSIIRKRIIDDYETPEIDIFLLNEPFRSKKEKPSLQRCLEVFDSISYYPGLYEILAMCSIIAINIVLIARKTQKYPDGVYVTNQPYPYFVFLKETYDRVSKMFYYEMIVKNKKIHLLKRSQIPSEFMKYINKKVMEYIIDV